MPFWMIAPSVTSNYLQPVSCAKTTANVISSGHAAIVLVRMVALLDIRDTDLRRPLLSQGKAAISFLDCVVVRSRWRRFSEKAQPAERINAFVLR